LAAVSRRIAPESPGISQRIVTYQHAFKGASQELRLVDYGHERRLFGGGPRANRVGAVGREEVIVRQAVLDEAANIGQELAGWLADS
jgi:hypothetical protein